MKLGEIAETLGYAETGGEDVEISGVAPLESAGIREIAYVQDQSNARKMSSSGAGALILPKGIKPDRAFIFADDPSLAFAKVIELFHPAPLLEPGIHETAVIGKDVTIGQGVHIGPMVTVGGATSISDGVALRAGVKIGPGCSIGANSVIYENTVLYDGTVIGTRCQIHANTTIGADGFGYIRLKSGEYYKIPQRGIVRLEDDVEIGASSTIDRATLGETIIKKGAKIDDQTHIGHNSVIGENVIIAGCSGIAGSVVIGDNVVIGGMVGVSDHVRIASGSVIAGKTGVQGDIKEPGVYSGPFAMKNMEYKRFLLAGKKVDRLARRIKELEKKINKGDDS